jgi:predicted dehydrogenase
MSKRRTVAVVGLGIGRSHIDEGYARLPDRFDLQAICDLSRERLAAVGDEFAVPRRTTSFDEVLAMTSTSSISARRRRCTFRKSWRRLPPASR